MSFDEEAIGEETWCWGGTPLLKFKLFFKLHYIKKSQDQIKYMDTLRIFRGATSFRRVLYLSNHREEGA